MEKIAMRKNVFYLLLLLIGSSACTIDDDPVLTDYPPELLGTWRLAGMMLNGNAAANICTDETIAFANGTYTWNKWVGTDCETQPTAGTFSYYSSENLGNFIELLPDGQATGAFSPTVVALTTSALSIGYTETDNSPVIRNYIKIE